MQHLFGYPVALVLRDERGEYEVRDALKVNGYSSPEPAIVDIERVLDAINARQLECPVIQSRPVY